MNCAVLYTIQKPGEWPWTKGSQINNICEALQKAKGSLQRSWQKRTKFRKRIRTKRKKSNNLKWSGCNEAEVIAFSRPPPGNSGANVQLKCNKGRLIGGALRALNTPIRSSTGQYKNTKGATQA